MLSLKYLSPRVAVALTTTMLLLTTACTEEFESFGTVSKLRILGISGNPPAIVSGEEATLSALVAAPKGDPVSYRWSWCPFSTGNLTGYDCAVDEEQFFTALSSVVPDATEAFPPFDLGTGEEVTFFYGIDGAILKALCEFALTQSKPDFVTLPSCDTSLTIQFTLEVTDGEESVTSVKEMTLLFDDSTTPNENPGIGDTVIATAPDGTEIVLAPDGPTVVPEKTEFSVSINIPESASETFTPAPTTETPEPEPVREVLFMTWFVEGGDTEFERTGFIDGDTPFEDIRLNTWYAPAVSDFPEPFYLYIVLQDERGGTTWITRQASVEVTP